MLVREIGKNEDGETVTGTERQRQRGRDRDRDREAGTERQGDFAGKRKWEKMKIMTETGTERQRDREAGRGLS